MNPERNNATDESDKMVDDEDAFDDLVKSLSIVDEDEEIEQEETAKKKTEQLTIDLSKSILMSGKLKDKQSPKSPLPEWDKDDDQSPPLALPCLTRSKTSQ